MILTVKEGHQSVLPRVCAVQHRAVQPGRRNEKSQAIQGDIEEKQIQKVVERLYETG